MKSLIFFLILLCACQTTKNLREETEEAPKVTDSRAIDHFTEGQFFELSNNLYGAIDEYKEALVYDSVSSTIYTSIGECYRKIGKSERGIKYLQKSVEINPNHLESHRLLSELYLESGFVKLAEKELIIIAELDPYDVNANYRLAYIALIKGENEKALKYFLKVAEVQPDNVRLLLDVADTYEKQDLPLEGARFYEKALEVEPQNDELREKLAELYRKNNQLEKALPLFEELASHSPDEIYFQLVLGSLYYFKNDSLKAQKNFKKAKELDSEEWRADFYLGQMALDNKELEKALVYFKNVFTHKPDIVDGWVDYGRILLAQNKDKEAAEHFKLACEKLPDKAILHYFLATSYVNLEFYNEAIETYKKTLEISKDNVPALTGLASTYDLLKKFSESDTTYELLLELEPKNALILNNYAYSLSVRGANIEKALEMSQKAVSVEPTNSSYLDTIGWIFYQKGDYQTALKYVEESENLSPSPNWEIFLHLGDIHFKLKNIEKAQFFWLKASKLNPKNKELKDKLGEINKQN